MNFQKGLIMALSITAIWCLSATDSQAAYQLLGHDHDSRLTYQWEGTHANRLMAETTDYVFDYGDDAVVSYALPWPFPFDGQSYHQITALADGTLRIGNADGPVIKVWNADLSSYYYGGIFIQHKTAPERVVIEWQEETLVAAGYKRLNAFEAVITPYGAVRVDYRSFDSRSTTDGGSGLSTNNGTALSITDTYGTVTSLVQNSFLFLDNPYNNYDSDTLTNLDEYLAGTNPNDADTDNDGTPDGLDTAPLDPTTGHPILALALTPESMAADQSATVVLDIDELTAAGETLWIQQVVDVNANGSAETDEPIVRAFAVTDGVRSENPQVPDDTDGLADGRIVVSIGYLNTLDRWHAPGNYVFKAVAFPASGEASFTIDPVLFSQSITGTVSVDGEPLPGALVQLTDKWQIPVAFAFTDALGRYELNVAQAGVYRVVPVKSGYVTDLNTVSTVELATGEALTGIDLTLTTGTLEIHGRVYDRQTDAGVGGIRVTARSADRFGEALSTQDGSYSLLLPAGDYTLSLAGGGSGGPDEKGYWGGAPLTRQISLTENLEDIDVPLDAATALITGQVTDTYGLALAGLPIRATEAYSGAVASAISDADGQYTLGVFSHGYWLVGLDPSVQNLGYIGNIWTDDSGRISAAGSEILAQNIESWITGNVTDSDGQPLSGIQITLSNTNNVRTTQVTAADGTYRLGAYPGTWTVDALTELSGYLPSVPRTVTIDNSQPTVLNFVAQTNTLPDLVITALTVPQEAQPGQQISISATLLNRGEDITSTRTIGSTIYLSPDAVITGQDRSLGVISHRGALAKGESATATAQITLPSSLSEGTYYVGVYANAYWRVAESRDDNNFSLGVPIQVGPAGEPRPDLTVETLNGSLNGHQITITGSVHNQGIADAGAFHLGMYLSTDNTITTADTQVAEQTITGLVAKADAAVATTVPLPDLPEGTYYVGAIADNSESVIESNETDNQRTGNTITIQNLPDLTIPSVSGTVTGKQLTINAVLNNPGLADAGTFIIQVYLSPDTSITSADYLAGEQTVTALASGSETTLNLSLPLPGSIPDGTYYVGLLIDEPNQIAEIRENNNAAVGNLVSLSTPVPDIVFTSISGPSGATLGQSITLTSTVENQGTAVTGKSYNPFWIFFYLSEDATITSDDRYVGWGYGNGMQPGETQTRSWAVQIPTDIPPGTYYLGGIADPTNAIHKEVDKSNNSPAGNSIAISNP